MPLHDDCGAAGGEATVGGDVGCGSRGLVMDLLVGVAVESVAVMGNCMMGFLQAPLCRPLCKEHSQLVFLDFREEVTSIP